jgi:hypothetical protein
MLPSMIPFDEHEVVPVMAIRTLARQPLAKLAENGAASCWDYNGKTELFGESASRLKARLEQHVNAVADATTNVVSMMEVGIRSEYLLRLLKEAKYWDLDPVECEPSHESYLGGFIFRHLLLYKKYAVPITKGVLNVTEETGRKRRQGGFEGLKVEYENFGYGVFPHLACFAHSCAPNATW